MYGFVLTEQLKVMVLVLGFMAAMIAYYRFMYRPKGSREFQTGQAKVVSRRVAQKDGGRSGTSRANPNATGFSRWQYLVTFEVGPQLLELEVTEAQFGWLKEGLTGEMEWQYSYLMSFEPDET